MIQLQFLLTLLLTRSVLAWRPTLALPGYGFSWYRFPCGNACYNAVSGAMLACTDMDHSGGGHDHGAIGATTPTCRANDTPYLTTLALCMDAHCNAADALAWQREEFWETESTGVPAGFDPVSPKWTYAQAVLEAKKGPSVPFNSSSEDILNRTSLVTDDLYKFQANTMIVFDRVEVVQSVYIFILLGFALGTPILLTWFGRLPFGTHILGRLKPYLLYPATIKDYNVRPLPWFLGNSPSMGQSLYIFIFFVLNIVLICVNYETVQPHSWGLTPYEEITAYVGYRTGHISFALLPLTILFSGRNNFLLWITNWSYSTYLLLHRWIARMFTLQAIIHSIALFLSYQSANTVVVESPKPYWQWGIVGTVLACAMLVLSHVYIRRNFYEVFLILHILLAVFVIAGCWYHIIYRWGNHFYMIWLYAAVAVWSFDRVLRVGRVLKNGYKKAVVTDIGADHVRVDIPGVRWSARPGQIAYAYFPTLDLKRPWENHPFSVVSTALMHAAPQSHLADSGKANNFHETMVVSHAGENADVKETTSNPVILVAESATTTGVTLIIKKSAGLTRFLKSDARLTTLLEGPYKQTPSSGILDSDRVLLIGGGIGIMGLLAWTRAHHNVKLAWGVRSEATALVQEVGGAIATLREKQVLVGERLNLEELVRNEAAAGYGKVGVVVCGPGAMCDEVRALVAGIGRSSKTVFELEVDAYSW
ncbi:ferric reductase like transmembrane component-domain-containing protein [Phlyctochytrium arcticum]|nr:ferric reductase like transmembrane component-domain-containing protein [Phlyctochytrium arcticum]